MTKWWWVGQVRAFMKEVTWRWAGLGQAARRKNYYYSFIFACPQTTHVRKAGAILSIPVALPYLISSFPFFPKGREKIKMVWSEPATETRTARLQPRTGTVWKDQAWGWFLLAAARELEQGWGRFRRLPLPLHIITLKHPPHRQREWGQPISTAQHNTGGRLKEWAWGDSEHSIVFLPLPHVLG